MKQSLYEILVLVNNREINEYNHKLNEVSDDKIYIEGREGSNFELKLINHSDSAVLMIPSVDGLSVIDGKPANQDSKGYIVDAHAEIIIPGWTLDDKTVAKFVFASKKKSYAANHQDNPSEANIGVIGVLVWSQKKDSLKDIMDKIDELKKQQPVIIPQPWIVPQPYYPIYPPKRRWSDHDFWPSYPIRYDYITCGTFNDTSSKSVLTASSCSSGIASAGENISASAMSLKYDASNNLNDSLITNTSNTSNTSNNSNENKDESFELGVGFGKASDFKITTKNFEKNAIVALLEIYYDTRKNLEKLGIIISKSKLKNKKAEPKAFAGLNGCKPPKNWK